MAADSFIWRCPTCSKPYRIKAGRKPPPQCPRCDEAGANAFERFVEAVAPPPEPEPEPSTFDVVEPPTFSPPKEPRRVPVGRWLRAIRWGWNRVTPWLCVAALVTCWTEPPGLSVAFLIAAVPVLTLWACTQKWLRLHLGLDKRIALFLIITVLGWRTVHRNSWFVERRETGDVEVHEYLYRNGVSFERTVTSKPIPGSNEYYSTHGPVSDTGKRHGTWKYHQLIGGKFESGTDHYWYGDKITEGEWHLRNKK